MMYSCAPGSSWFDKDSKNKKAGKPEGRHPLPLRQSRRSRPRWRTSTPAQHEPSVKYANALTREVNVKQMQERGAQAVQHRGAAEGHGPHGHRHPGGLAGAQPDLLLDRPGAGRRARAHGERAHRRDRGQVARPLRRPGHRAAAGSRSGGVRARVLREEARHARGGDQPQRQRHGPVRRPPGAGEVLRQGAGARRHHLHAPDRLHAGRAAARPLLQQRDRQPARDHGGGQPPDLRRRDGAPSEAEGGAAARRRLSSRTTGRAWTTAGRRGPIAAR